MKCGKNVDIFTLPLQKHKHVLTKTFLRYGNHIETPTLKYQATIVGQPMGRLFTVSLQKYIVDQ